MQNISQVGLRKESEGKAGERGKYSWTHQRNCKIPKQREHLEISQSQKRLLNVEKLEPCALLKGMGEWCSHCENSIGFLSENISRIIIRASNSTSGFTPKRVEGRVSKMYLHRIMLHVHRSIIHSSWKIEAAQMSFDRWAGKQSVMCTCNGVVFSLKKRNSDTLQHQWTLRTIVLREVIQSQKDKCCMIPLVWSTSSKSDW